jgi:hypothetical protein
MVVMDIAVIIPIEVVLAHMVEGGEAEGHVEAEEAVVFFTGGGYRSIDNHPTVENPKKKLPRRGGFQNKDRT